MSNSMQPHSMYRDRKIDIGRQTFQLPRIVARVPVPNSTWHDRTSIHPRIGHETQCGCLEAPRSRVPGKGGREDFKVPGSPLICINLPEEAKQSPGTRRPLQQLPDKVRVKGQNLDQFQRRVHPFRLNYQIEFSGAPAKSGRSHLREARSAPRPNPHRYALQRMFLSSFCRASWLEYHACMRTFPRVRLRIFPDMQPTLLVPIVV